MGNVVFLIACIIGSVMILTACLVYFKNRIFGTAGAILSVLGVVLIGMSVWKTIGVSVTRNGFEAKLVQVEKNVSEMGQKLTKAEEKSDEAANSVARLREVIEVRSAQETLQRKGFYHGQADGYNGPLTQQSIKAFQLQARINPTGSLDKYTKMALGIAPTEK